MSAMRSKIFVQPYSSPCGELLLGSVDGRLCLCNWAVAKHPGRVERRLRERLGAEFVSGATPTTCEAARQLDAYFSGELATFSLPLLCVGTAFQLRVWAQLRSIPYGATLSYGELARRLGCPSSVRAVANANGANALSLFLPCHRVVGADRSLTGYGGGLEAKRFLLGLEQRWAGSFWEKLG